MVGARGEEGVRATSRYMASLRGDGRPAEDVSLRRGNAAAAGGEPDAAALDSGDGPRVVDHHGGEIGSNREAFFSDGSISRHCAEVSLESSGESCYGFPYADGLGRGAGTGSKSSSAGRTGQSRESASSRPCEQVSLPEDIYGAARVPEYWRGMQTLSSLASAYVYDDIWAGDGGLNSRYVFTVVSALRSWTCM